ncbi:MAG TPA: hypothetical protein VGE74_23125 [Gemmata sp.]
MEPGTEPTTGTGTSGYEWQWGWALAVLANLPVPLGMGLIAVWKGSALGMFAGIVAFWLVGAAVIARVPLMRSPLVHGGLLFAVSQFVPVVQFFAGAAAMDLCAIESDSLPTDRDAFLVTVVTGGLLLTVALSGSLFFGVVGWLFAGHPHRDPA